MRDYLIFDRPTDVDFADLSALKESPSWSTDGQRESKIHQIHAYPAKFPAFLTTKALGIAHEGGRKVERVADVFCGCGTVALETQRAGIDFWGCDINPVATLIARAKSLPYVEPDLHAHYEKILIAFNAGTVKDGLNSKALTRLRYWYLPDQLADLQILRNAINDVFPCECDHKLFFLCAFSNILKATSRWLTKSIKPTVDRNKKPADVRKAFVDQCSFMFAAYKECVYERRSSTKIVNADFLRLPLLNEKIDTIITSPPYVTSYQYADLHQLSSLWLEFTDDFRKLREGSIGRSTADFNFAREVKRLNSIGTDIVFRLYNSDKAIARTTTRYFLDMQAVARKCFEMLTEQGMAFFVMGNTEYKGVKVDNARHLTQSLLASGFRSVRIEKRKISNKICTPHRDNFGRFSRKETGRQIYGEEFILIAKK
jgi:methylase of polypeptide subunit release factors